MLRTIMNLDLSSPVPLYQQLQDILRTEIAGKVRKPAEKLYAHTVR